jgi:hypothetical protein
MPQQTRRIFKLPDGSVLRSFLWKSTSTHSAATTVTSQFRLQIPAHFHIGDGKLALLRIQADIKVMSLHFDIGAHL